MEIKFAISDFLKIKYIDGEKATVSSLAQKIGVSQPYMSNLVNNKVTPSLALLQKIADVFQVNITDLFEEDKQPQLTSLVEFEGNFYKAQTLNDLKSIVEIIEDKNLLYYNLWSRSQSNHLRKLSGGGFKENDNLFLQELEKKKNEPYKNKDMWLRELLVKYIKVMAVDYPDYPLVYYINWLNHTKLITRDSYTDIYNWCLEYEAFLFDHLKDDND